MWGDWFSLYIGVAVLVMFHLALTICFVLSLLSTLLSLSLFEAPSSSEIFSSWCFCCNSDLASIEIYSNCLVLL